MDSYEASTSRYDEGGRRSPTRPSPRWSGSSLARSGRPRASSADHSWTRRCGPRSSTPTHRRSSRRCRAGCCAPRAAAAAVPPRVGDPKLIEDPPQIRSYPDGYRLEELGRSPSPAATLPGASRRNGHRMTAVVRSTSNLGLPPQDLVARTGRNSHHLRPRSEGSVVRRLLPVRLRRARRDPFAFGESRTASRPPARGTPRSERDGSQREQAASAKRRRDRPAARRASTPWVRPDRSAAGGLGHCRAPASDRPSRRRPRTDAQRTGQPGVAEGPWNAVVPSSQRTAADRAPHYGRRRRPAAARMPSRRRAQPSARFGDRRRTPARRRRAVRGDQRQMTRGRRRWTHRPAPPGRR